MVYECETCETVLTPGLIACPRCGQIFDEPVPDDATAEESERPPPPPIMGEPDFGEEGRAREEGAARQEGAASSAPTGMSFPGSPELGRGSLSGNALPVRRIPRRKSWAKTTVAVLLLAGAVWLGSRHWTAVPAPLPVSATLPATPTDLTAHPQYAANMAVFVQKLRATGVGAEWPAFGSNDVLLITPQPRVAEAQAAWNADMYRRLAQGIYGQFAQNRYESGFSETDTTACFVIVINASGQIMAADFMGNLQ